MSDHHVSNGALDTPAGSYPGAILVVLTVLYFMPAIIAFHRQHHNRVAIRGLNVLLGWSVLGWVVAFLWALTAGHKKDSQRARAPAGLRHRTAAAPNAP